MANDVGRQLRKSLVKYRFAAIACLIGLSNWDFQNGGYGDCPILLFLSRHNYLGNFIRMLKQNDDALLQSLTPGTGDRDYNIRRL
jgi:hypothetical protein